MLRYKLNLDKKKKVCETNDSTTKDLKSHQINLKKIEKRIMILLVFVCSIPFWPLLLAGIGFQTNFMDKIFHLQLYSSSKMLSSQTLWIIDLIKNLVGYGFIFVPIYCASIFLHRIKYDDNSSSSFISNFIKRCLFDQKNGLPISIKPQTTIQETHRENHNIIINNSSFCKRLINWWTKFSNPTFASAGYYFLLILSALGLQISYLTWGVLQERIMTQKYGNVKFTDSQFLVFINRLLAVLISCSILTLMTLIDSSQNKSKNYYGKVDDTTDPPIAIKTGFVPYFKYSYASLSNILSSWCQYEALKFVSFPVQVLAKASKIIPVMLMGKLIRKQSYRWDEYITAATISVGVALFLLDTTSQSPTKQQNEFNVHSFDESIINGTLFHTISGMILLVGYMICDSFTSNWQDKLFKSYKINSFQMMAGVNAWSCIFTISSLLEQGGLFSSISFANQHPQFFHDAFSLSLCGAVGQLFIFFTISKFGALTFTVIMTTRQALAILLSCTLYGHPLHPLGIGGLFLVFLALFSRSFLAYLRRKVRK